MANIKINNELNGIEISFDSKPEAAVISSLKENGFRWSPKNKLWYAKQTAERMAYAESIGTVTESTAAPAADLYNLDNLGARKIESYYCTDLSKVIREELKNRGVKGCTVRGTTATYTPSITVTIKATAEDMASMEEATERYEKAQFDFDLSNHGLYCGDRWIYSNEYETMTEEEKEAAYYKYIAYQIKKCNEFCEYHHDRNKDLWMLTTSFYKKCEAAFMIANQFNWNNSDSMTDYFDIGYFLDIDIKVAEGTEPRATMTEAEKAAYIEEKAQEEADHAAWLEAYEKEQEERKAEAEKYNNWVKESENLIYNNIVIEDLEEAEQLYIKGLKEGHGKECNKKELEENAGEPTKEALITRKIIFTDSEALNRFNELYLHDFDFIAGKGGTASEDERLKDDNTYFKLTPEQRESIKFYCTNCIAIYFNNELQLVIDPEGYNYSRYTFLVDEATITEAAPELEKQRTASNDKEKFYFPEPVEQQAKKLTIGEPITIYQCDGWILESIYAGSGTVTGYTCGTYAQYKGVYIDLISGKKQKRVFIRDGKACLIYKGIKCRLPDSITREQVSENMYHLYNYSLLIPNTYNYYKELGEDPIIDTWQR